MRRHPTIALVLLLACAASAQAQTPVPDPPPEQAARVTRRSERADDPYALRVIGFPIVGYTPDTSWGFAALGLAHWRMAGCSPESRMSSLAVAASYTLRNQWLIGLDPTLILLDDRIRLGGSLLLDDWEADYFGIGDDARFEDQESYTPRRVLVEATFEHAVGDPRLFVGFVARATDVRIRDVVEGGLLDTERPPGIDGGTSTGLGGTVIWDSRDLELYPSRGAYARLLFRGHHRAFGGDFDHLLVTLDLRGYLSVGRRPGHILAGQFRSDGTAGDVPFFELPRLGGMNAMRGMTTGRFRDTGKWESQIEYRSPFVWRFAFVGFASLGDVFSRLAAAELDDPKWTAGVGLRFRLSEESGANMRLDYGVTSEEFEGVYLSISEAF